MEELIKDTENLSLHKTIRQKEEHMSCIDFIEFHRPEIHNASEVLNNILKNNTLPGIKKLQFRGQGQRPVWCIPIKNGSDLLKIMNTKSRRQSQILTNNKVKDRYVREEVVRDCVASLLGGRTEICVDSNLGRIDVLTTNSVIEIKYSTKWINAVGQVLIYSNYYPEHKRVLWLYGPVEHQEKINKNCEKLNIKVVFDNRWRNGNIPDNTCDFSRNVSLLYKS